MCVPECCAVARILLRHILLLCRTSNETAKFRHVSSETWMKTKSAYVKICWHHTLTHVRARPTRNNTRNNNNNNSCWMFGGYLDTCTRRNGWKRISFDTKAASISARMPIFEFWWKSIHLIGSVILHEIKSDTPLKYPKFHHHRRARMRRWDRVNWFI